MAWPYDQEDSELEKQMHQVGGQIQQGAQNVGNALDSSLAAKMHALHKLSGSAAGPGLQHPSQAPLPMQSGPAPMNGASSGQAQVGTMDAMAAQRQKMLDMYNAASQEKQNAAQEPDFSDYKPFQALKNKIQDNDDDEDKNTRGSTTDTGTLGGI